jgi:hypothetical protein
MTTLASSFIIEDVHRLIDTHPHGKILKAQYPNYIFMETNMNALVYDQLILDVIECIYIEEIEIPNDLFILLPIDLWPKIFNLVFEKKMMILDKNYMKI